MRSDHILIAAAVAALGSGAAMAADLPTHKPPAVSPAAQMLATDWSGFYFGLNGGYARGASTNSFQAISTTLANFPTLVAAVNGAGSQSMSETGGAFGAQAGYLWQASESYAFGVEADAGWSGMSGSINTLTPLPLFGGNFTMNQRLDARWTSSLRARLGFVPAQGLMVYVTGGAALAGFHYASQFNDRFNEFESVNLTSAKPGWVAGGGLEYKLGTAWSARLEYLHSQYSALTGQGSTLLTDGTLATVAHSSGTVKVDSFRLGVNYFPGL